MDEQSTAKSTAAIESTKRLILNIARALVHHEDQVEIEIMTEESRVSFLLHVDSKDMGRIIGKQGRTALAFRTLINGAGTKSGYIFSLDIRG